MFYFITLNKYRHIGFLNYWTFSNLPLFVVAAPMLIIMTFSALESWTSSSDSQIERTEDLIDTRTGTSMELGAVHHHGIVQRLAIPQFILVVLTLTTYHVQIITRLSSGYPVWYWWLASSIIDNRDLVLRGRTWKVGRGIVRWMVIYALIQGGLFASFLPPA